MITSNNIIDILEEYFDTRRIGGKAVVIYKNPISDDVKEFPTDFIRFLADSKTKTVYAWDGYSAIHIEVWPKTLGNITPSKVKNFPNIIPGKAMREGTRLTMVGWDGVENYIREYNRLAPKLRGEFKDYFQQLFSYNWSWLDNYVIGANKYILQEKSRLKL